MLSALGSSWVSPALGAGLAIAVHYMFLRAASGRLGDALGALILEGTATVGIAIYYVVHRASVVATTVQGILYSVASGLGISVASILFFAALRRGGPVASTGTIVLGGGVALSALVAPFIFGEAMTVRRVLGVGLGICAIAVLSTER